MYVSKSVPARLLTLSLVMILAAALPAQAYSDAKRSNAVTRLAAPIEYGSAGGEDMTAEQRIASVQVALVNAGGAVAESGNNESEAPYSPAGGYGAYPLVKADLDGDGSEELLLIQSANVEFVTAIEDGGVLWRGSLGRGADLIGGVPGDFSATPGVEVLIVFFDRGERGEFVMALADSTGIRWQRPLGKGFRTFNGVVEADTDSQSEIAITVEDTVSTFRVTIIDGEQAETKQVRSTLGPLGVGVVTYPLVTDSLSGTEDDAIFITRFSPTGYSVERRSLRDGTSSALMAFPEEAPVAYQGRDYTGDGRRDAYTLVYNSLSGVTIGVFDPVLLRTVWSRTIEFGEYVSVQFPVELGDANGGGKDFCLEATRTGTTSIQCFDGDSGSDIWSASLSVKELGYTRARVPGDIDGDGVLDPIITAEGFVCDGGHCEPDVLSVAYSGVNGSRLWSLDGYTGLYMADQIVGDDLDGREGGDAILQTNPTSEVEARFGVLNGLTLQPAWDGAFDTEGVAGYADHAAAADLDGDGSSEVLVTGHGAHLYVTAFELNGQPLWQIEI